MEDKIREILQINFEGQDINPARAQLCFLFGVMRNDEPICPYCGKSELIFLDHYMNAKRMTGAQYKCKNCEKEFEFDDYA